jgi:diketogulonate reductase-like aldo/keto reductase
MNNPNLPLSSGYQIPQLGLGLWKMKDEQECKQAVQWALELGYRHFDTAQIYGNEAFLGAALQESGIARKDVFVTTKLWTGHFFPGKVMPSFEASLKKLQTNYVDLLLLHFPVPLLRHRAWRKLEEIYQSGLAKSIGVSNYTIRHLERLLKECSVKPVVNQVELHVFLQQPELVKYCQDHDIVVEAYSPLAHANNMDNPVLAEIAEKYGKTSAQIMLRWCIEQDCVAIPKSVHKERLQQNLDIFDFKLDQADHEKLKQLDQKLRTTWDPTRVP